MKSVNIKIIYRTIFLASMLSVQTFFGQENKHVGSSDRSPTMNITLLKHGGPSIVFKVNVSKKFNGTIQLWDVEGSLISSLNTEIIADGVYKGDISGYTKEKIIFVVLHDGTEEYRKMFQIK